MSLIPISVYSVVKDVIAGKLLAGIKTSVEITIVNRHKAIQLRDPRLYLATKIEGPLAEIHPDDTRTSKFEKNIISRGMLSYEIWCGDECSSLYLVVTWAAKAFKVHGKNSVTAIIQSQPPEKVVQQEYYKIFHEKSKRKYADETINLADKIGKYSFRITGAIDTSCHAKLNVSLVE